MQMRSLYRLDSEGPEFARKLTTAPVRSCGLGAEVHSAFRLQRSKPRNTQLPQHSTNSWIQRRPQHLTAHETPAALRYVASAAEHCCRCWQPLWRHQSVCALHTASAGTPQAADLLHSTSKSRGQDAARSPGRLGPLPVPTTYEWSRLRIPSM